MITSRDNAKLKLVRSLQRRREREETGLFVCEGEDLLEAAAAAGIEPVELLVEGENVAAGLLAHVSTLPHPARAIGVYRAADLPRTARDTCLALWRVSDPGNVGTIVRTADAFGAAVALSEGCADPLGPKAVRATAGAIFRVPVLAWDEAPEPRVALVAHGGEPIRAAALEPPVTLLVGAERGGLPHDVVAGRRRVTIELPGAAESLNVAAAAAVALYELSRR